VTTTGITTTASAVAAMGLAGALGLVTVLTLLVLVIGKDMTTGENEQVRMRWGSQLNVVIAPLTIVFVVIAIKSIVDIVS
jgi:hypothetical protein